MNVKELKSKGEVEQIMSTQSNYDKKHKLNTTEQEIPMEILNSIEVNGITTEQIEELLQKGYDIYKYQTQITLHGKCKELDNDRIGWYKCLVLNKNQSIGIRWIAVDRKKRMEIIKVLNNFGFNYINTSTDLYPCIIKRFDTKEDAITCMNEIKKNSERIDNNLFWGFQNLFMAQYWGMYYVVYELCINGILQKNVKTLLEQIVGLSYSEINNKIREIEEEKKREEEEREKKWEEERKRQEEEDKVIKEELNKQLVEEQQKLLELGYTEVNSNDLPNGTIFLNLYIRFEYSDKRIVKNYYKMEARTASPCNEKGNPDWCRKNMVTFKRNPIKVWIKK